MFEVDLVVAANTLHFIFLFFQRVLVSFNYVFFISSLFFFPVLSRIFYKNEDEKSNQKISRDERTSESKSARGRTFSFGWIKKKCFIQAHCFRRKSRSQTTNKKLFCSRERERIWRRGWRVRLNSSVVEWESEREREIHSCHRRNSNPPVPNRRQRTSLPLFSKKKRQSACARGEEGRETRTRDSKSERRIEWSIYLRVRINICWRDLAFVVSLLCVRSCFFRVTLIGICVSFWWRRERTPFSAQEKRWNLSDHWKKSTTHIDVRRRCYWRREYGA